MSFRRRIAIAAAAAVAIAVAIAAALTYVLTSDQLQDQLDSQLSHRSADVRAYLRSTHGRLLPSSARVTPELKVLGELGDLDREHPVGHLRTGEEASSTLFGHLPPGPDQVRGYQEVITSSGRILLRSSPISLPVTAAMRAVAAHGGPAVFSTAQVSHGGEVRILAEPFGRDRAILFAQPMSEVNSLLGRLRLILIAIVLGGIALAALLGRAVAGAALAPLRRLTQVTQHVARTNDLSERIRAPSGEDELTSLATSFNAMLDALERSVAALDASVHAQRQLVADASHELRTPVTSMRTNIELLQARGASMEESVKEQMLDEVVQQIEELTVLINDLIDLARGEEQHAAAEELRLDHLIEEVVQRARKRRPDTAVEAQLQPTLITGVPARLERAVSNLIDNAQKYGAGGGAVEVRLLGGVLTVRDHGPGIDEEDLPHIFDRFYRGAKARGLPGSGLGLAIVRQVAQGQGGSVEALRAPGGGTLMRMTLPRAEPLLEQEPAEPGRTEDATLANA